MFHAESNNSFSDGASTIEILDVRKFVLFEPEIKLEKKNHKSGEIIVDESKTKINKLKRNNILFINKNIQTFFFFFFLAGSKPLENSEVTKLIDFLFFFISFRFSVGWSCLKKKKTKQTSMRVLFQKQEFTPPPLPTRKRKRTPQRANIVACGL